tara:strand:- start:107 stop:673 length:567 start_codon:yes stop_codon:yes gene_type:complete
MASKRPHTDATGFTPALGTCAQLPDEIWLVIGRLCNFVAQDIKETSKLRLVKRSLANQLSPMLYKQAFKRLVNQRAAKRTALNAEDDANEALSPIQRAHRQYTRHTTDILEQQSVQIYLNMCNTLRSGLVKTPEAAGFVALLQLNQQPSGLENISGHEVHRWGNAECVEGVDAGLCFEKIPLQLPDSA